MKNDIITSLASWSFSVFQMIMQKSNQNDKQIIISQSIFLQLLEEKHLEDPRKLLLFQTPTTPKKTNCLKDFDSVINCSNPPINADCLCLIIKSDLGTLLLSKPGATRKCRTEWDLVRRGERQRTKMERGFFLREM